MTTSKAAVAPANPADQVLGIGLAVLGVSAFATKGIIVKLGLAAGMDSITILAWRMLISVPVFVAIGVMGVLGDAHRTRDGRPRRLTAKMLLGAAAVGVIGYFLASLLDFIGLAYVSAQFDRLILMTSPFFVLLIGAIAFGRRVTPRMIGALLVSYAGIAVIFARDFRIEGEYVVLGTILVLGSAIAFATYQILAKPVIDALGPRLFTSIAMASAGMAVIAAFFLSHPAAALTLTPYTAVLMLTIGTISTLLPSYAMSAAIGRIGSERTAVIGNLSPLVTIVLATSILGERFTPYHAVGTALVLAGVVAFTRITRRP